MFIIDIGAEFYRTDRGGLITFHGPGQLVVYPILNLKQFKYGMRQYVCNLERTIIELCNKYRLHAETSPHTGVWINDNKVLVVTIQSWIGFVKIFRFVSSCVPSVYMVVDL